MILIISVVLQIHGALFSIRTSVLFWGSSVVLWPGNILVLYLNTTFTVIPYLWSILTKILIFWLIPPSDSISKSSQLSIRPLGCLPIVLKINVTGHLVRNSCKTYTRICPLCVKHWFSGGYPFTGISPENLDPSYWRSDWFTLLWASQDSGLVLCPRMSVVSWYPQVLENLPSGV